MFSAQSLRALRKCISELPGAAVKPCVAIEPIETPTSDLEKSDSVANRVISALLELYIDEFLPADDQPINVRIAIPWHRFDSSRLALPHRLQSYMTVLKWRPEYLETFIDRRIKREFERRGRHRKSSGSRPWDELFESEIRNQHCTPAVDESTFAYILRHTHHRPRDLQQITRLAIETCSQATDKSMDAVIRGEGGLKIHGKHVMKAVANYCRSSTEFLLAEGARRYPAVAYCKELLMGIKVPFTLSDLNARLKVSSRHSALSQVLVELWDTGVIGLMLKDGTVGSFAPGYALPEESKSAFTNVSGTTFRPAFFFYYNTDLSGDDIYSICESESDASLVLHPRVFDVFLPKIARTHPIGI